MQGVTFSATPMAVQVGLTMKLPWPLAGTDYDYPLTKLEFGAAAACRRGAFRLFSNRLAWRAEPCTIRQLRTSVTRNVSTSVLVRPAQVVRDARVTST